MRTCLAKIIPALSFSVLVLAAFSASPGPQTKSALAKKAPAKAVPPKAAPQPTTLVAMVHALRETPSAPHRAAVEAYAAAHPKEAPLAHFALGIAAYETKDYAESITE